MGEYDSHVLWNSGQGQARGNYVIHVRGACTHVNMYDHSFRQCCEGSLRLLEVSLDIHLVHNALQLDLEGGAGSTPLLLPDITIHEYDSSSVVVLFATSSAVYRLILPHPAAVVKVHVHI